MFDIHEFLKSLSKKRPIFHSEADFQHAFAWELHQQYPEMNIRLEYPRSLEKQIYLDIWAQNSEITLAIELKYKTRVVDTYFLGEHFLLKNHGAQDIGRYDFLKDIERIETVVNRDENIKGFAILLTNEESYLSEAKRDTFDKAFRINNGKRVSGELAWGEGVGGTAKNRERSINIRGNYEISWNTYSVLDLHSPRTHFQYLAIQCS